MRTMLNHGKHKNMVFDKEILDFQDKTIKLKQNLNLKIMEFTQIYAENVIAAMQDKLKIVSVQGGQHGEFVGIDRNQVLTKKNITDETALFRHYYFKHKNDLQRFNFDEAYQVVFLEEPDFKNLD